MRLITLVLSMVLAASSARADPSFWVSEWPKTDFGNTSVSSWIEVMSGGPPRDGIPALDDPPFHSVGDENALEPQEPVITVEIAGQAARAYPLRYLIWHEIVNDVIGDVPVAVTFCPLCNSAVTFDRRTAAGVLTFGVTGKLRNSDMLMFDRQTESWWQQAIGIAIVGDLTGSELQTLPSWVESWEIFAARNPDGLVMAQPTLSRPYGANPYVGYDTSVRPFLFTGEMPPFGLDPLIRVVRVGDRAWPLTRLAETGRVTEAGVTIDWTAGQASALDAAMVAGGRDIGNIRVRDTEGRDIVHDVMFAFAFHAFWPNGTWMLPEGPQVAP